MARDARTASFNTSSGSFNSVSARSLGCLSGRLCSEGERGSGLLQPRRARAIQHHSGSAIPDLSWAGLSAGGADARSRHAGRPAVHFAGERATQEGLAPCLAGRTQKPRCRRGFEGEDISDSRGMIGDIPVTWLPVGDSYVRKYKSPRFRGPLRYRLSSGGDFRPQVPWQAKAS